MMKNKKIKIIAVLVAVITLLSCVIVKNNVFKTASARQVVVINKEKNITVYTELGELLFERAGVVVGDYYMSKDYKKYVVVEVNYERGVGLAEFVEFVKKPNVTISDKPSRINIENRKIGLYCTHNDESYLPTDGYYTIYGKGGIHDIAKSIKTSFQNSGVEIFLDESLHLPHDNLAYNRSRVTAQNLLKNNLDAVFDIHRDATPRSFYATTVNGREYSKVRIVVGMANSNMKINEEFALYLVAVAEELYPWLIADIYYATGHYNQNLFSKSLLFEMGTYLIEKDLVERSVDPLVHTVNVALFGTTVNENDELEIGGVPDENNMLLTDKLQDNSNKSSLYERAIFIVLLLLVAFIFAGMVLSLYLGYIKPRFIDKN